MDLPKFDDMFRQINYNLWISGIPYLGRLNLKFYVSFFSLTLVLIMEMSFFWSKLAPENFLELTSLAPCIGIGMLSCLKVKFIASKRRQIYELTSRLKKLYNSILDDDKIIPLVAPTVIGVYKFTKYFFILNGVLISVFNFSSLLIIFYDYCTKHEITYSLPYAVLVPFSTDAWYSWLFVYIHSISSGFVCVVYYTTVDCLYYNLSSHVCINFTVLCHKIKQLNTSNVDMIRDIVIKHQYILKLADDLEEIFSLPNFYNVLFGSIEMCALGFNIMTADWTSLPGFCLFILSELVQIFVMSVFGENILRESIAIGDAVFDCEWYEMDKSHQKMILIILTRSNRPQRLTAFKFSTISYQSFTKIISTSWSYFTILRTVYYSSKDDPKI